MHGISDFQPCQINVKTVRNLIRYTHDRNSVAHDIDHTAGFKTRRFRFIQEMNRHLDRDFAVSRIAQEIDMHWHIRDGVVLRVTGQNPVHRAVDIDVEQSNEKPAFAKFLFKYPAFHRDRQGFFLVAVN